MVEKETDSSFRTNVRPNVACGHPAFRSAMSGRCVPDAGGLPNRPAGIRHVPYGASGEAACAYVATPACCNSNVMGDVRAEPLAAWWLGVRAGGRLATAVERLARLACR